MTATEKNTLITGITFVQYLQNEYNLFNTNQIKVHCS